MLKTDPRNARKHPDRNKAQIAASLRELGAGRSILVDATDTVIAGNGVYEQAQALGYKVKVVEADGKTLIAVKRPDLKGAKARRMALADNRATETSEWDVDVLADLAANDAEALAGLFEEKELRDLLGDKMPGGKEETVDATELVDKAAELQAKWQVQRGDVWQVGKHRLMCGDSTNAADVATLMQGEKARLVWTDPPYNVSYQDNESIESLRARNRRTDGLTVSNDSMSDAEFDNFLYLFLSELPIVEGSAFYLCAPAGRTETQFRNALERVSGLTLRQCIVWVKNVFVFGRQDYHWRHESILYGWKDGSAHYFIDDHTQDTVWEIERPRDSKEHPTMKPVALAVKAINNSSKAGELVFDGFLGSGTTLVACEQTGRIGRGMEIEPKYCAVALERLSLLGLDCKRVNDGSGKAKAKRKG